MAIRRKSAVKVKKADEVANSAVAEASENEQSGEGEQEDATDDEDLDFDVDAIAEKAVAYATKVRNRQNANPITLDISIDPDMLYMPGGGSSSSRAGNKTSREKKISPSTTGLNTAAVPGVYQVDVQQYSAETTDEPLIHSSTFREVRGAPVRPVNDAKLLRAEAKKAREEKLKGWFGLPKHKMTPELERELQAIKLRASFDPKRFYKAQDTEELPKYFTIATEVGGGMAPVGLNTRTKEVHAYSGRSFLDTIMRDQKAQEWTSKKSDEAYQRELASSMSGHGKRKVDGARSTRRGGAWKKTKKS